MSRALTMHFHNVSGKSAHAERRGIDAGGSCGRHAIRCVCVNNAFTYRRIEILTNKFRVLYISILLQNSF